MLVEDNHMIHGHLVLKLTPPTICWCLIKRQIICNHQRELTTFEASWPNMSFLMSFSCRSQQERVQHEAGVEIPRQDEVSEETLHYSLPWLPHHLPPLPEPLHWRWLRAGELIALVFVMWEQPIWPNMLLKNQMCACGVNPPVLSLFIIACFFKKRNMEPSWNHPDDLFLIHDRIKSWRSQYIICVCYLN